MGERRERRMRGPRLLAAVVLASLALGGCTLVEDGQQVWGILQQDAATEGALKEALVELRQLEGVNGASSRFLSDGPRGDESDVHVTAEPEATDEQLVTITAAAHELLSGAELSDTVRLFSLKTPDGGQFTNNDFTLSAAQLADEVTYWAAAQRAIDAPLSVKVSAVGDGEFLREVWPGAESDSLALIDKLIANQPDLRDLPQPPGAIHLWLLPGLDAESTLPPAGVLSLLGSIRQQVPLLDYSKTPDEVTPDYEYPEGAMVRWRAGWPGGPMDARVAVNMNEYRESDWQTVLRVGALAAAVPGFSFSYVVTDEIGNYREWRFFTTSCNGDVSTTDDDRTLVAALAAAGTVLPAGGGAGSCNPVPAG